MIAINIDNSDFIAQNELQRHLLCFALDIFHYLGAHIVLPTHFRVR